MKLDISHNNGCADLPVSLETIATGVQGSVSSCKRTSVQGQFRVVVIALNKDLTFNTDAQLVSGQVVTLDVLADRARLIWLAANVNT